MLEGFIGILTTQFRQFQALFGFVEMLEIALSIDFAHNTLGTFSTPLLKNKIAGGPIMLKRAIRALSVASFAVTSDCKAMAFFIASTTLVFEKTKRSSSLQEIHQSA